MLERDTIGKQLLSLPPIFHILVDSPAQKRGNCKGKKREGGDVAGGGKAIDGAERLSRPRGTGKRRVFKCRCKADKLTSQRRNNRKPNKKGILFRLGAFISKESYKHGRLFKLSSSPMECGKRKGGGPCFNLGQSGSATRTGSIYTTLGLGLQQELILPLTVSGDKKLAGRENKGHLRTTLPDSAHD